MSESGSPSNSHRNCGGGEPVAEQRKETIRPGRIACSMNVCWSSGTVSGKECIVHTFVAHYEHMRKFDSRNIRCTVCGKVASDFVFRFTEGNEYTSNESVLF